MYGYLLAVFGPRLAPAMLGFIYALMVCLILYSIFEPQAELKYTAL